MMIRIFRSLNFIRIKPFPLTLCPGEVFEYGDVFTLPVFTLSGDDCLSKIKNLKRNPKFTKRNYGRNQRK